MRIAAPKVTISWGELIDKISSNPTLTAESIVIDWRNEDISWLSLVSIWTWQVAGSIRGISNPIARTANEHGQTCFCESDVAPAADHFPQWCRSLQRRAQGQTLHDARIPWPGNERAANIPSESLN